MEEGTKNPSSIRPKTSLGNVKPKLLRTRELGLTCLNPECNRKLATVTERNCYMMINNNAIEDEQISFPCLIASCNMRYRRKGWLTQHITECHHSSERASTSAATSTTPATENKTRIRTTATTEFKCLLGTKILPTRKGMNLYCYFKYRFSVLKGMFLSEITVGTTTRSSESR